MHSLLSSLCFFGPVEQVPIGHSEAELGHPLPWLRLDEARFLLYVKNTLLPDI